MSANSLRPLTQMADDDREDFVLVEYIMAFALHRRGIVQVIV